MGLEQVMEADPPPPVRGQSPDPADTFTLIDELLTAARRMGPRDAFDELAVHRLVERRALLEQHAHRRPPTPGARPGAGSTATSTR